MDLKNKKAWQLTPEEIEYAYNNLHMNNYIYAALNCYHKSKYPRNRIVRLRKEKLPVPLIQFGAKLAGLSPYLGNDDPKTVRINYTYYAFNLFRALKSIKRDELDATIGFLASLSYIPIIAEKNDDFPLWHHPITRDVNERIVSIIEGLAPSMDIPSFIIKCAYEHEDMGLKAIDAMRAIFIFVIRSVQAFIIICENGGDKEKVEKAIELIESNMLKYEKENGLDGDKSAGSIKHPGQIRYRNTLYLYGGDFERRNKNWERAFSLYTKDIYFENLPDFFVFYLTDMKTVERLICAYFILRKQNKEDAFLRELIDRCMMKVFEKAASFANETIDILSRNPEADISAPKIKYGAKERLYAGEPSRELFLISLLYKNMVSGTSYEDINYEEYLKF